MTARREDLRREIELETNRRFGELVHLLREQRGITVDALAEALRCDADELRALEAGDGADVTVGDIAALGALLGIGDSLMLSMNEAIYRTVKIDLGYM